MQDSTLEERVLEVITWFGPIGAAELVPGVLRFHPDVPASDIKSTALRLVLDGRATLTDDWMFERS